MNNGPQEATDAVFWQNAARQVMETPEAARETLLAGYDEGTAAAIRAVIENSPRETESLTEGGAQKP